MGSTGSWVISGTGRGFLGEDSGTGGGGLGNWGCLDAGVGVQWKPGDI